MIEGLFQPTHLIIILVMVLIVFGAGKLPEVGGALGKGIREFKQGANDELPAGPKSTAPRPATTPSTPRETAGVGAVLADDV